MLGTLAGLGRRGHRGRGPARQEREVSRLKDKLARLQANNPANTQKIQRLEQRIARKEQRIQNRQVEEMVFLEYSNLDLSLLLRLL